MLGVVIRYRRRPGRVPSRTAEHPRIELVYAAVLTAIAAVLLVLTFRTEARTDRALAAGAGSGPSISVTASKWRWTFVYARTGVTVTGDDTGPTPTLTVPASIEVRFELTSPDVIHSFWIPGLRFKRLAYPAYVTRFNLVFPRPGFWRDGGECAEFCGLLHAEMRFNVNVVPPAQFTAWLAHSAVSGVPASASA